jgi:drug/metabolite transporter (DMT)-like permease
LEERLFLYLQAFISVDRLLFGERFMKPNTGTLLILFATFGFSLKSILAKMAYSHGSDPVSFMMLRVLFSIPIFVVALWAQEGLRAFVLPWKEALYLARVATLGFTGTMVCSYIALDYIDASLATLLGYTYPAFTLIFLWMYGRGVSRSKLLSAGIIFGGLLMLLEVRQGSQTAYWKGIGLSILGALAFAYYNVHSVSFLERMSPLKLCAFATFFATAGLFGMAFLGSALDMPIASHALSRFASILGELADAVREGFLPQMAGTVQLAINGTAGLVDAGSGLVDAASILGRNSVTGKVAGLAFAISFFCSFLSLIAFYQGLRIIGAARAVLIASTGPLFTVGFAILMLGEALTSLQYSGMALVIAGALFGKRPDRRPRQQS